MGLPRLAVARLPTPLDEAPRLAAALGLARLWVKREDLSGTALGGNKLRKLDLILGEARELGADTLVTTAGEQSNFCRALAGASAKAGLSCHLHLRRMGRGALQGNLLLDHVFGATISYTALSDPWDPRIRAELDALAGDLIRAGRRPHVVQLTGATAALGAAAWVGGAAELAQDLAAAGAVPDVVAVACGSGLTLAGLALGFKHLGVPTRLIGFSVQQPARRLETWVMEAAEAAGLRLGIATRLQPGDVSIVDDHIGPGYGIPSAAGIEAVRLGGRTEGLVLDPVYTGKALAGLAAGVRSGLVASGASAVFLHSGGTPGLFTHAAAFESAAP